MDTNTPVSATLRTIAEGAWKLAAVKSDSKSWTVRGQAGRFEPSAEFDKYTNVPMAVIAAYVAVPFDAEDAPAQRAKILADAKLTGVKASSAVPFTADDFVGWASACGTRADAGRRLAHGILVIPEVEDVDAAIDAVFATIGVDSSTVFATAEPQAEDATEDAPEPTAEAKPTK